MRHRAAPRDCAAFGIDILMSFGDFERLRPLSAIYMIIHSPPFVNTDPKNIIIGFVRALLLFLCYPALSQSAKPYAPPRVRFFFVSLWRATQIGVRCLEMWIFCLFLFNTFVFVKLYRLLPDLQKTPFCTVSFSARHRRLAPQGGKALRFARARIPAHCRARVIRYVFLMARHANRDTVMPCNACSAAASRHKEACPARGQSSSLRSSTNPCTLSCASDPLRFPYGAPRK